MSTYIETNKLLYDMLYSKRKLNIFYSSCQNATVQYTKLKMSTTKGTIVRLNLMVLSWFLRKDSSLFKLGFLARLTKFESHLKINS